MEEIRGPAGRTMWDKLGNVNEAVLANYLKNEYPQTVAVVLSKIKPEHAARVLAALPEDFALECVMRMLRMEPVQKDILDKVEQTLRTEFMSNLARTAKRDSHEHDGRDLQQFRPPDRKPLHRRAGRAQPRIRRAHQGADVHLRGPVASSIRAAIQTLLRSVEKDKLALALKGASDALRDMFFSNMSERAGKILREDMEAHGPGAPEGRRRGADAHGQGRQGPRQQGRNHDRRAGSGEDELIY